MRSVCCSGLVVAMILMLGAVAVAGHNQFGVSDLYQVNFTEKVIVGTTLLPAGNYEIRHVMEGQDHIMVFHQMASKKPVEVRIKCTLVALPDKAAGDQKIYELNASNERVLHELIFKGDTAKHVF